MELCGICGVHLESMGECKVHGIVPTKSKLEPPNPLHPTNIKEIHKIQVKYQNHSILKKKKKKQFATKHQRVRLTLTQPYWPGQAYPGPGPGPARPLDSVESNPIILAGISAEDFSNFIQWVYHVYHPFSFLYISF